MRKECEEEASLPPEVVAAVRPAGLVSYRYTTRKGLSTKVRPEMAGVSLSLEWSRANRWWAGLARHPQFGFAPAPLPHLGPQRCAAMIVVRFPTFVSHPRVGALLTRIT